MSISPLPLVAKVASPADISPTIPSIVWGITPNVAYDPVFPLCRFLVLAFAASDHDYLVYFIRTQENVLHHSVFRAYPPRAYRDRFPVTAAIPPGLFRISPTDFDC